jgi:hypothetical protein
VMISVLVPASTEIDAHPLRCCVRTAPSVAASRYLIGTSWVDPRLCWHGWMCHGLHHHDVPLALLGQSSELEHRIEGLGA